MAEGVLVFRHLESVKRPRARQNHTSPERGYLFSGHCKVPVGLQTIAHPLESKTSDPSREVLRRHRHPRQPPRGRKASASDPPTLLGSTAGSPQAGRDY